ncbi:hypothetical protein NDR89_19700 [Cupriavidus gilardii]|uniref:Uncharacterized protein n=1 Tax=Cupriavidus gilardii TaxID=82541 RepID=A0ABY4VU29_9BURK|nr:hypothetical protein [Cupriavidus gilardii]USE78863.1 hypothetical protein NDR89_19700 [Cupriavidus gilardii]
METMTLEKLDAHLRALEAAFIALAKVQTQETRERFFTEFDRNLDSIAAAFSTIGRTDDWKESLYKHRHALKDLIS